jgi:energy-coupling factor transporter ATP-binding protein EcfA2
VIVTIDAIENIRVFAKTPAIDAKLPTPAPGRGQWIVIIGENGAGKTTLLRSLAFALATPAASGQLVTGHPSFIRNSGDGIVGVTLDSTPLRVRLRRNEKGTLTFLEEQEPYSARPWVVGYGVQRAGATGEPDRKPLYDETGALGSLFDLPYALTNAKAFLTRADHNALSEERKQGDRRGPKNRLWNELRAAMQQLLGVHSIEVDDGVWVRLTETSPRVAFDTLSHGYLSMAGWVSDLVARWLERLEDLDDEYPANIFATMTGIVLVDEIDMHLHPRWQLTVIEDLRKLFPRLTFVATTHNPLTLHGAQPGEIFVLTKDATGAPILQQRDIRPGSDVDRVLFDVFGVHQTFDKTTRDLLEQHRALVQRGVPFDSDERTAIERQLRERLGAIGALINEQRGGSSDVDDDMRALAQQRAKSKPVAATTPKKTTDTKKKPKRSG